MAWITSSGFIFFRTFVFYSKSLLLTWGRWQVSFPHHSPYHCSPASRYLSLLEMPFASRPLAKTIPVTHFLSLYKYQSVLGPHSGKSPNSVSGNFAGARTLEFGPPLIIQKHQWEAKTTLCTYGGFLNGFFVFFNKKKLLTLELLPVGAHGVSICGFSSRSAFWNWNLKQNIHLKVWVCIDWFVISWREFETIFSDQKYSSPACPPASPLTP